MAPLDENKLIQRCRRGDLDAFAVIFQIYRQRLYAVAFRLLGRHEEAEDVLQDVFVKLFDRIGQYRFDSAFSTWLHRIVVNHCYDRLKSRQHTARIDTPEMPDVSCDSQSELRWHLQQAIAELPPRMKTCFVLYAQEGFKQQEIAGMLDMKEGTVKAQVFAAKSRLREAMNTRLQGWQGHEL